MSIKSALLAGTAAIAIASPAFAGTGDAYISLFGGWSSLAETGFNHYQRDTSSYDKQAYFIQRGRQVFQTAIQKSVTKNSKFSTTKTFVTNFGSRRTGILTRTAHYDYQRSFSGDVTEEGFVIGAALGVDLMQGLRVEVEAAFRRYDLDEAGMLDNVSFYRNYLRRDAIYTYLYPVPSFTGSFNTRFKYPTKLLTNTTGTRTFNNQTTPVTYKTDANVKNYWTNVSTSNLPVIVEGELASFSFMVNLWYDLPLGDSGIVPFVGGGVGVANLTLDYRVRTPSDIVFASGRYREFYVVTKTGTSKTYMKNTTTRYKVAPTTAPPSTTKTDWGTVKSYNTVTNTNTLNYRTPRTFATTRSFGTAFKDDVAVFAYQFGAGLGYEFDNGLRLTAQYRYFATGEADFGRAGEVSVESSDVLLGVSFPLGRQRVRD